MNLQIIIRVIILLLGVLFLSFFLYNVILILLALSDDYIYVCVCVCYFPQAVASKLGVIFFFWSIPSILLLLLLLLLLIILFPRPFPLISDPRCTATAANITDK